MSLPAESRRPSTHGQQLADTSRRFRRFAVTAGTYCRDGAGGKGKRAVTMLGIGKLIASADYAFPRRDHRATRDRCRRPVRRGSQALPECLRATCLGRSRLAQALTKASRVADAHLSAPGRDGVGTYRAQAMGQHQQDQYWACGLSCGKLSRQRTAPRRGASVDAIPNPSRLTTPSAKTSTQTGCRR